MKKYLLSLAVILCVSCEKADFSKFVDPVDEANVILHLSKYEQEPFSRAASDISEVCSRVNVAIFNADGSKVKTAAQKAGDDGYGTVAFALTPSTYKVVVMAHNGEGSATITSVDRVTFPNNKVTDTFYYYGDLVVGEEPQTYDLVLTRAVAMFRWVMTDEDIPNDVVRMKFYYVGGSSTFSPQAGFGCVQSKQTEYRSVEAGNMTFDLYTLPHTETDVITRLTATALDANDNVVSERVMEDIPVTRNRITTYTGPFFTEGVSEVASGNVIRMTANPAWDGNETFTY